MYSTFDIDDFDPAHAPGTGTPEIGGLNIIEGMEIVRGRRGLQPVGTDLVEVAPPYDLSSNASIVAANLMFAMLCVLADVKYRS